MQNVFDFLTKSTQLPNKRELGQFLGLKTFDTAYPQAWADKVRELGLNPSMVVFCYDEPTTFGKPVDLSLLLIYRMAKDVEDFAGRQYQQREKAKQSPMKTVLPESITTIAQAKSFLLSLYSNGEAFHPEDDAKTIIWHNCAPTEEQLNQLNKLMEDIYNLNTFDPCEYILSLEK